MSQIDVSIQGVLSQEPVSRLIQAGRAALYQEGLAIMADSQEHYVPVDEAVLKSSGHVTPPEIVDGEIRTRLSYGGAAKAYALAVHEHLSAHSPRSWRIAEANGRPVQFHPDGHGPKYLERPLLAAMVGFAQRIRARMRLDLGI